MPKKRSGDLPSTVSCYKFLIKEPEYGWDYVEGTDELLSGIAYHARSLFIKQAVEIVIVYLGEKRKSREVEA